MIEVVCPPSYKKPVADSVRKFSGAAIKFLNAKSVQHFSLISLGGEPDVMASLLSLWLILSVHPLSHNNFGSLWLISAKRDRWVEILKILKYSQLRCTKIQPRDYMFLLKNVAFCLTNSATESQMTSHPIHWNTCSASGLTDRLKRNKNMENSREGSGKELDGLWQVGCTGQKWQRVCEGGDISSVLHSEG